MTMTVKRTIKDSVFRKRFNDNEKLIELYNALEGTDYSVDTEVEINTLDYAIYSGVKNDVSFIINGEHNVFLEHQSSQPLNVPLKCLLYLGATYTKAMDKKELHRRIIRLPTPKFYVFYNGDQPVPQEQILRLSDSFIGGCGENTVELKVKMININYNESKLLERSPHLKDYAYFVHLVKLFKQTSGTLEDAVKKAIDVCINENVMADFLKKNRQEVIGMSLLGGTIRRIVI